MKLKNGVVQSLKCRVCAAITALLLTWACGPAAVQAPPAPAPAAAPEEPGPSCSTLELRFVVDRDYDLVNIFNMIHGQDPAGLESRATEMGITINLANAIYVAPDFDQVSELLNEVVDERYRQRDRDLQRGLGAYRQAWEAFVGTFSQRITRTMGLCWLQPRYTVVVSVYHPGISSWTGATIAARYDHDEQARLRIVAHELVLSQVFQLVRRTVPEEELGDWHLWALSEITAVLLLADPELDKRWPRYPSEDYFSRSNYPQLAALEARLGQIFRSRKDFQTYLEQAIAAMKKVNPQDLFR